MEKSNKFASSRITQLRSLLDLSQTEFARKIGISQGALSQLENGRTNLSIETLRSLSKALNVNCNWVVNGDGEIFGVENEYPTTLTKEGNTWIPLVKEEAHAGYVKNIDDQDYIDTLDVYQIPGFEKGNFRLFEIEGDSMEPTIYPKEIVVCEPVEKDNFENGVLAVVITKESIVAKRIYKLENEPDSIILRSDNNKYKTFKVEESHVVQIWKMVAKITSQFIESKGIDNQRLERLESHIENLRAEMKNLQKGSSSFLDAEIAKDKGPDITDTDDMDDLEDAPKEK